MIRPITAVFVLFFLSAFVAPLVAQTGAPDSAWVYIDSLILKGNRKTKNAIILRELEFAVGDSLPVAGLQEKLTFNSQRLLNLGLFTVVEIRVIQMKPGNHVDLVIDMTETWYLLPVPVFALIDRNFNVWWKEFNRSLLRTEYGIDLTHNNLSGAVDALKMKLIFGYTNSYELSYVLPPLNPGQTLRMQTAISYSRRHEVAYQTLENKLQFYRDPDIWNLEQFLAFVNVTWRPGLFNTHTFSAEYRDTRISDTIARVMNPDFFLNGQNRQRHASLLYKVVWDYRDIRPFPLNGWLGVLELRQNGLLPTDNLHLFRMFAEYAHHSPLKHPFYLSVAAKGRFSLPRNKPPYYNNQALGYFGNFVRGYEYYVSDGLDFAVFKSSIHIELLNKTFNMGKWMPFKAFRKIPLKCYLSINNDLGYANDPYYTANNPLVNRPLYGYGLGFDLLAWYNKTVRIEYTRNDIGEGGVYIRVDAGF
jgi:outer membrane protein assembly factor BamA